MLISPVLVLILHLVWCFFSFCFFLKKQQFFDVVLHRIKATLIKKLNEVSWFIMQCCLLYMYYTFLVTACSWTLKGQDPPVILLFWPVWRVIFWSSLCLYIIFRRTLYSQFHQGISPLFPVDVCNKSLIKRNIHPLICNITYPLTIPKWSLFLFYDRQEVKLLYPVVNVSNVRLFKAEGAEDMQCILHTMDGIMTTLKPVNAGNISSNLINLTL